MMRQERGVTLVEILLATAVAGVVLNVIGAVIHEVVTVTEYGNDSVSATHELQNISHWLSVDGQKALAATGGTGLVLTLPGGSVITYGLEGTELHRVTGGSEMILAWNISDASFSVEDRTITALVTASPPGRQGVRQQGTYRVYLRPTGE